MKRLWILMIGAVFPFYIMAQQQTEYNRKGDEAMKRLDYRDAKMWYEEGVAQCDSYSINQLTTIWLSNEPMRPSMRSLMNKCLNCLTVKATEDDMKAISDLIIYYTEGIGTPRSEELAVYWKDYQKMLLTPASPANPQITDSIKLPTPKKRMEFFAAYAYSIESPYGITVGGVGKRFGWYVRFKTNMSFMNYTEECNNQGQIPKFSNADKESYEPNKNKSLKTNSFSGTFGLVVKCFPWLYGSVGLGYGERSALYPFLAHGLDNYDNQREFWCKNMDASYRGVAAEVDIMAKIAGPVFISAGCGTINFKYVDFNAGVGVFF